MNNYLNKIAEEADKNGLEDTYIGVDGLHHCRKCGGAREVILSTSNGDMKVRCLCECETAERDERDHKDREEDRLRRINENKRIAFKDKELANCRLSDDDMQNPRIHAIAEKYIQNFSKGLKECKGLVFYGSVGTGKTFISACIANELLEQGYTASVTNFSRLINQIKSTFQKEEMIDELNLYDLLVIDDYGVEAETDTNTEIIMNIIDARYRAKKPIIVTTNMSSEELKSPTDFRRNRIMSRLYEMCLFIEVKGYDRRKKKQIESYNEWSELLGVNHGTNNNG